MNGFKALLHTPSDSEQKVSYVLKALKSCDTTTGDRVPMQNNLIISKLSEDSIPSTNSVTGVDMIRMLDAFLWSNTEPDIVKVILLI